MSIPESSREGGAFRVLIPRENHVRRKWPRVRGQTPRDSAARVPPDAAGGTHMVRGGWFLRPGWVSGLAYGPERRPISELSRGTPVPGVCMDRKQAGKEDEGSLST